MKRESSRGYIRLKSAFANSLAGLRDIWRREAAFRFEVLVFSAGAPAAFYIGSGLGQIGLLIGSLLAVMIVEIVNTALEATIDRVSLEHHELSRIAKDLGSAAVLLTCIFPCTVWIVAILEFFELVSI